MFQWLQLEGLSATVNNKIYILISLSFLISTSQAIAGIKEDCMNLISSLQEPDKPPTPIHPSQNADYQKYLKARARNPRILPPTAMLENDTTAEELKYSFFFWWYPGNVFERLMVPKH